MTAQSGRAHLVGLAGVGMSALAEALRMSGRSVSGSDRGFDRGDDLPVLDVLARQGIRCYRQDGSGVAGDVGEVIVSTAIESDNPDLLAATKLAVPVVHRSQALAPLVDGGIAVTGTCGKSTVTAMIGWVLEAVGRSPRVVNGAPTLAWMSPERTGAVRWGGGARVFEADESDRSLSAYTPDIAVVTNVFADHFSESESLALFRSFAAKARSGVIGALDRPDFYAPARVGTEAGLVSFTFRGRTVRLATPGAHNGYNAYCALEVCAAAGVPVGDAVEAIESFTGLFRRFQFVGARSGVRVYDDYAHNPEKLRAAFLTASELGRHVILVWRPHGYGPLNKMRRDLGAMFEATLRDGDRLLVLPVYDAGGTADRRYDSDAFVGELLARGLDARATTDPVSDARALAGSGDVILVAGARDPALPALARRLLDGGG